MTALVLLILEDLNHNTMMYFISRYNQQEEMKEFARTDHECGICFDVQTGSKFFLIPQCSHAVCVVCMKEHCQILLKDGAVLSLRYKFFRIFLQKWHVLGLRPIVKT